MLTRDQAKKLADQVLALSKADEAHVSISGGRTTHLRFARNTPSTSGEYDNPTLAVSSVFGKRTGTYEVNQLDPATLEQAVRRSEEIAKLAPEDREHMPALGPQTYRAIPHAFDAETADRGAEKLAQGVSVCLKESVDKSLVAAGFTETSAGFTATANSKGLFGYHTSTGAYVAETARTADGGGSGWASDSAVSITDLDYSRVSAAATSKALGTVEPKQLEPGSYTTILEPACVANLVSMLMWSMDARSADEGRSFFSKKGGGNRVGEKLFGDQIEIYSDPMHAQAPGSPWGSDGLPQQRVDWIKGGALANLRYDRFWADQAGKSPIPYPSNIIMSGGSGTVEDLIASTKKGVLITSLWYIRSVDPRSLLLTGLTRDGVFWIENGKISHPVTNFRWNDSPIAVLKNVVGMSGAVQIPPRPSRSNNLIVPALKLSKFHLSSVSEAV